LQVSVSGMLLLVACAAFNFWLFKIGPLWGLIGLNLSKHVIIAYLCQILGVNRAPEAPQSQTSKPVQARVSSR